MTLSAKIILFLDVKPQRLCALDVAVLSRELNESCAGGKIEKILRDHADVVFVTEKICFAFRIRSGAPYLTASAGEVQGSSWLPFLFESMIDKVSQVESDRIIAIDLIKYDRLGRKKKYILFFEIFGPGNLIVTDSGLKILASFRDAKGKNPGEIYGVAAENLSQARVDSVQPPVYDHDLPRTYRLLRNDDARIVGFAESTSIPPITPPGAPQRLLEVLAAYVESLESGRTSDEKSKRQNQKIANVESKIKQLEAEIAESEKAGEFRKYGSLVLANLRKIQKGDRQLVIGDPDSMSEYCLYISLDPALTPQANARRYFEKARKMEIAQGILTERLKKLRTALEKLRTTEGIGDKSAHQKQEAGRTQEKLPFRHFDLGDGWHIYAGKSAENNEELTFGFAAKHDLWFHAWQAGGSHVILRKPNKQSMVGKAMLEKAASLAAYYSKSRTSGKAAVVYAEVRYLRKVKGIPGKVIVSRQKQLMVKPRSPASLFGGKIEADDK